MQQQSVFMNQWSISSNYLIAILLIQCLSPSVVWSQLDFQSETIDSKVAIGYGIAIGDVDGDGDKDILLADKKEFVWYENPNWERHVMVENLTARDNVCIAARDIDGDGRVEVAVGANWNPGDTNHSGSVHYLVPPKDRRERWQPVKLHNEPVVHRMRWLKVDSEFKLVVSPLHGRGNQGGEGVGAKLLAYSVPEDREQEWPTELLDGQFHVTHNFEVGQWSPESTSEDVLQYGREGLLLVSHTNNGWRRKLLDGVSGGGEVRMGMSGGEKFIATIQPFHGDKLVVYENVEPANQANGKVLTDQLAQGHALATGDLLGIENDQIVVGWRTPNENRETGIQLYWKSDGEWRHAWIDKNQIACEDLRLSDLDGDGDLDIVAAGRATHNLIVYWNQMNPLDEE